MQIKLGYVMKYYPDGISRYAYDAIGRLIRKYGDRATIAIDKPGNHNSLDEAIKRAERGMVNTAF